MNNNGRLEVRLAGFGGQGIILAGYILGKAAGLYGNKHAVFTQSYGPEARGGACAAQVIVSDDAVDYPMFDKADCVVVMSQEAFQKYGATGKPGANLIVDTGLVKPTSAEGEVAGAPFTRVAEELGNRIVANIVMLGYLTGATELVSRDAMEEAIRTEVKARFVDLNMEAFLRGFTLAQKSESTP